MFLNMQGSVIFSTLFISLNFIEGAKYLKEDRIAISNTTCPFNEKCLCITYENALHVVCLQCSTFPKFAEYNVTGYFDLSIQINGNLSSIPASSVYPLYGSSSVSITITGDSSLPLSTQPIITVDPKAFAVRYPVTAFYISFSYFSFPTLPASALANTESLYFVQFWYCNIPLIVNESLFGVTCQEISFTGCNIEKLANNAFDGLNSIEFQLIYNPLQDISVSFKIIDTEQLLLEDNNIAQISDYAFCQCENSSCPNTMLVSLTLSNNPISFISEQAFANLPNLAILQLTSCQLVGVPSASLSVLNGLSHLFLDDNDISSIEVNSFYSIPQLTSLSVDSNRLLSVIEPGAFNGLTSISTFNLQSLDVIISVDILITYGMSTLTSVEFSHCPNLNSLMLSDFTKLPPKLNMIIASSYMNVTNVGSEMQYWLNLSKTNLLDISHNEYFICDASISWMAKYACCSPVQIQTQSVFCPNVKQLLIDYLQSFQPVCN